MNDLVTIFTSCYNQAEYLPDAIKSVFKQTYKNWEYLLYDDGSTDHTWKIMKKYSKLDKRIKIFKLEKQTCPSFVLNRSISDSTGKYWIWLPADDYFHKNMLLKKIKFTENNPDSILYSWMNRVDKNKKLIKTKRYNYTQDDLIKGFERGCIIGFTGIWIPISVFDRIGNFPENITLFEDFYWGNIALLNNIKFECVNEILCYKRIHKNRICGRISKKRKLKYKNYIQQILEEIREKLIEENKNEKTIY